MEKKELKTKEYTRRAIRAYEERIKADPVKAQKMKIQKGFSSCKSFIRLHTNLAHLDEIQVLLDERRKQLIKEKADKE